MLCGLCDKICVKSIKLNEAFRAMRELCAKSGLVPEVLRIMHDNIQCGNPLGIPKEELSSWATKLGLAEKARRIFVASNYTLAGYIEAALRLISKEQSLSFAEIMESFKLTSSARSFYDNVLRDAIRILEILGTEVGYMFENEPYLGAELFFGGYTQDFVKLAEQASRALALTGAEEIITPDPICAYLLNSIYPRYVNFKMRCKMLIEVILEKINQIRLELKNQMKLAYYNSSTLSHKLNLMEEPKELLRRIDGVTLLEPRPNYLRCFDTPILAYPKLVRDLSIEIKRELLSTGASQIVCADPIAEAILRSHAECLDLTNLLSQAIKI